MTNLTYYLVACLMAALPVVVLLSGVAPGVWWWRPAVRRADQPVAYWVIVTLQVAMLCLFLFTGRSWHLRSH